MVQLRSAKWRRISRIVQCAIGLLAVVLLNALSACWFEEGAYEASSESSLSSIPAAGKVIAAPVEIDAGTIDSLDVRNYPRLGPEGRRVIRDDGLEAELAGLLAGAEFVAWGSQGAFMAARAGLVGGYSSAVALISSDGSEVASVSFDPALEQVGAPNSLYVGSDGMLYVLDERTCDAAALEDCLDRCVNAAVEAYRLETDPAVAR